MDAAERAIRQRLKDDFEHYGSKCLKIRTKSGKIVPFQMNEAQRIIHAAVERQLAETGRVRAIILKGRQQGCSTYIGGRFYWKTTHRRGVKSFILTHEDEATSNLFEMTTRFHENCPKVVRPHTSNSNAKELYFDKLDSGYKVGTAGNKGVGRSSTVQLFHGSEVAFWPNALKHAAGVMQAIPDEPGTEVFKESTANGPGNYFHKEWQDAEAGKSEYIAIFIPWFKQSEYRKRVPVGFDLDRDETEYRVAYGLDLEQMAWRRAKITELKDLNLFKQEYPATAAEAFQNSGTDPFVKPEHVMVARKAIAEPYGPKHLGVDPARFGDDRTSMCFRQGRAVPWIRSYSKLDTMQVVGKVRMAIAELEMDATKGDRVFIDVGGLGAGVYDRLRELVDPRLLVAVNSSESPLDDRKYTNKRAEMWGEMNDWIKAQPAQIPDSDELQADLTQIRYSYDSSNSLRMEKKEDMKRRGFRSPDNADALGLTFAAPPVVIRAAPRRPAAAGGWMG